MTCCKCRTGVVLLVNEWQSGPPNAVSLRNWYCTRHSESWLLHDEFSHAAEGSSAVKTLWNTRNIEIPVEQLHAWPCVEPADV